MALHPTRRIHEYTYEAYLDHEASSNVKHEFVDGEIYAMAGGTIEHAIISANVISSLSSQLRGGPYLVASSDLKVRVAASGMTSYPDVSVICGPVETDSRSRDVVLNPTVVVEVLSASTEKWDRGEKLEHYKKIPSLQACVLCSHRERGLEIISRGPDGSWTTRSAGPGETAAIASIGVLAVDDVYRGVELP